MSQRYFLGADVGGTKTRVLIADETGLVVGFGQAGPGNHEVVGYPGLAKALQAASLQACGSMISLNQIAGAGFGIGGYDFPSEAAETLEAIASLGLKAPVSAVNDTIIGLMAGSPEGWGIAIVSGTGCNCWGWDRTRQKKGQVTGAGSRMGEAAGASELVEKAIQAVTYEWARRGPATQLTPALIQRAGAKSLDDLIEGILLQRYSLRTGIAPLIFEVASCGDPVAREIIHWAGCELGELARCVIRQLEFQDLDFDTVLVGSMFEGGPLLTEPLKASIHALAPGARLIRLADAPVTGAVLLGMEAAGELPTPAIRQNISSSLKMLEVKLN